MKHSEKYVITLIDIPAAFHFPKKLALLWQQMAYRVYIEHHYYISAMISQEVVICQENAICIDSPQACMIINCSRNPCYIHDPALYRKLLYLVLQNLIEFLQVSAYYIEQTDIISVSFINPSYSQHTSPIQQPTPQENILENS